MLLFEFIVKVKGVEFPLASPDHCSKTQFGLGCGVRVTVCPAVKLLEEGERVMVPPSEGEVVTDRV
ncbi:hypothetical protein ADIS_1591 [Lunatimonas lonarensis]|uniref:Uncharacterized protein n=1 Tax=Lunatimonas lonarensis TaxID=1232681 RepID=R7ZV18_9BACT|nr:hypothetical protein ADIS_1591 [Lunatimonas lonarensis]